MNYNFITSALLLMLMISNSYAQQSNAQKILGCWVLTKMEYSKTVEGSEELIDKALNSVVCFEKNGRFIHENVKNHEVINGSFSFAEDGKTITQSSDEAIDDDPQFVKINSKGEIVSLDKKSLVFRVEYVTLYFKRK